MYVENGHKLGYIKNWIVWIYYFVTSGVQQNSRVGEKKRFYERETLTNGRWRRPVAQEPPQPLNTPLFDLTVADGKLFVGFLGYENADNTDFQGKCCDGDRDEQKICSDDCDLIFEVSVERLDGIAGQVATKCPTRRAVSARDAFLFPSEYEEVTNPVAFNFKKWKGRAFITTSVFDKDKEDMTKTMTLVDKFVFNFTQTKPSADLVYHEINGSRRLRPSRIRMVFRYACDPMYWGNDCGNDCRVENNEICPSLVLHSTVTDSNINKTSDSSKCLQTGSTGHVPAKTSMKPTTSHNMTLKSTILTVIQNLDLTNITPTNLPRNLTTTPETSSIKLGDISITAHDQTSTRISPVSTHSVTQQGVSHGVGLFRTSQESPTISNATTPFAFQHANSTKTSNADISTSAYYSPMVTLQKTPNMFATKVKTTMPYFTNSFFSIHESTKQIINYTTASVFTGKSKPSPSYENSTSPVSSRSSAATTQVHNSVYINPQSSTPVIIGTSRSGPPTHNKLDMSTYSVSGSVSSSKEFNSSAVTSNSPHSGQTLVPMGATGQHTNKLYSKAQTTFPSSNKTYASFNVTAAMHTLLSKPDGSDIPSTEHLKSTAKNVNSHKPYSSNGNHVKLITEFNVTTVSTEIVRTTKHPIYDIPATSKKGFHSSDGSTGVWPVILGAVLGSVALVAGLAFLIFYNRQKVLQKRQSIYNVNPKLLRNTASIKENGTTGRSDVALETEQV